MLHPFLFQPLFKERIWGGRELNRLYGKPLPGGKPIGESWEISDRPEDASVIANGPFEGKTLRWLMENHGAAIMGDAQAGSEGRFPLLCKILDARDKLSLQVHPPAEKARQLKGEPKTEMWYIADAAPGAGLFVGLRRGVTREEFERRIKDGSVAECFHRIPVKTGDTMFLPSGRVHAIGEGLVIFEIQQNSDTTYRVFDWNRTGLDGRPRDLHVAQSLASIDFNDFEPKLVPDAYQAASNFKYRHLVQHPLFDAQEMLFPQGAPVELAGQCLRIIAVIQGAASVGERHGGMAVGLKPGDFCLIPACLKNVELKPDRNTTVLCIEAH